MPNEFEKIVQQKMDELKLVPSDPVWQKVEEQIRKKKDRRKIILWISFLGLLIAGGLWIGIDHYSNKVAYRSENNKTEKQNSISKPQDANKIIEKVTDKTIKDHQETTTHNVYQSKLTETRNLNFSFHNKLAVEEQSSKKINQPEENLVAEKKKASSSKETAFTETNIADKIVQESVEKKDVTDTVLKIIHVDSSAFVSANKEKTEVNISKTDSAKHDTASIKKITAKKIAQSKWKYNLVAASGLSGVNRLSIFNGQKSLAAYPAYNSGGLSSGGNQYYGPSAMKKGFAFSVGVAAKKELSKRTSFLTGLQYSYYSNTIQVGNRVVQNRTIMDFAVAQYYSNRASSLQPYYNHYHFVSLPATIDWQFLKTLPLNFHAALSLQYLIQTNALRFDYNSQSYFHNIKAFNRVELFSDFDLTYSVLLKQKPIMFGPQLQYGLTTVERGNSTNHLMMYGLKAQWHLGND